MELEIWLLNKQGNREKIKGKRKTGWEGLGAILTQEMCCIVQQEQKAEIADIKEDVKIFNKKGYRLRWHIQINPFASLTNKGPTCLISDKVRERDQISGFS